MSQIHLRPQAEDDLVERTHYYRSEADHELAERFFDSAIARLDAVRERPESGSLRIGELCDIANLRVRQINGFPCGWFYFIRPEFIDVVRLLAYAQDLPSELSELD